MCVVWLGTLPAQVGDLLVELVGEHDGEGHALLGLVRGVAEHQALEGGRGRGTREELHGISTVVEVGTLYPTNTQRVRRNTWATRRNKISLRCVLVG